MITRPAAIGKVQGVVQAPAVFLGQGGRIVFLAANTILAVGVRNTTVTVAALRHGSILRSAHSVLSENKELGVNLSRNYSVLLVKVQVPGRASGFQPRYTGFDS